jgi:hypothetical protein
MLPHPAVCPLTWMATIDAKQTLQLKFRLPKSDAQGAHQMPG